MMTRFDFIKKLYYGCSGDIELRAISKPGDSPIRSFIKLDGDWSNIDKQISVFCLKNQYRDIYFGIASRDGKGGKKENIISFSCVWAEMDYKHFSEAPEIKVKEILDMFSFKPTVINNSGGGLHLYWQLEKPVDITRREDVEKVNDWIRLELNKLGNCEFDNISEAAHILRLPDTINHKYSHKPLCKIAKNNNHVYTLDDFLKVIPVAPVKPVQNKTITNTSGWLEEAMKGVGAGKRNSTGIRIAGLFIAKCSPEEVHFILQSWNNRNDPPMSEDEISGILKSALGYIDKWQDIIPFDSYSGLPKFPSETLPIIGKNMVEKVAGVNQVDIGLPASIYLAVLSTCLSKKVNVNLGTHTEPVNVYTCPILDPGERKTATMRLMTSPVYKHQEIEKISAIGGDDPPIYVVDDITAESLFKEMSENNERMSVISAEGGIFGIMAGRYNSNGNGNIDVYLKGHAGDPCSNHRIGRKAQSMNSPSLTMCLAVQRDIIREIGNNKQFRGKGLLARFLFSNCQHKAGYRNRQKTEISYSIKEEYKKHILELMKKPLEPQMLELSPDAHKAWDDFYEEVEKDMSPGGEMFTIKDWGSKLAGAVARIAGLLHCAKYGDEAVHKPISVTIVDDSVTIGRYYRSHALASFGLMGEDYQIESAKKILEYLLLHKPGSFKGRDVLRHKNIFKNMGEITPGLNLLVERNYIREAKNDSPVSFGRPEAIIYEVNPQVKML